MGNFNEAPSQTGSGESRCCKKLSTKQNSECRARSKPLNQLAQINVGDARLLVIQPWDKNAVEPIAKAIQNSDLSISPSIDGAIIRLNLPPLTEERRRDLVKMVKSRGEEAKVSVRSVRRDAQDTIRMIEKEGEAPQDDCQRAQKDLQKLTDDASGLIDSETSSKEEEVMQI